MKAEWEETADELICLNYKENKKNEEMPQKYKSNISSISPQFGSHYDVTIEQTKTSSRTSV